MTTASGDKVVAIIGGGFTGAAVAYHLARRAGSAAPSIVVFEPREVVGGGLAYDTAEPSFRINVPAGRMTLLPEDEAHFTSWIASHDACAADPAARTADGSLFPGRAVFGRYVAGQLAPLVADGRIDWVRERVDGVEADGGRWLIRTSSGARLVADFAVIATSHPPPALPRGLDGLSATGRVVGDVLAPGALDGIGAQERLLIIGSGLTAADAVAALKQRGHRGPVTLISRRGLRSRGHAGRVLEPRGDFLTRPAKTALELLVRVREEVARADADGSAWQAVFDALRAQARGIWAGLAVKERRKIVERLRPFWDVHRFRIAPQVNAVLDAGLAAGEIELIAASLADATAEGEAVHVTLCPRGSRHNIKRIVDRILVTTGPAHRDILTGGYLKGLSDSGHIRLDAVGLGLDCDANGHAIGSTGRSDHLLIAGPLARGSWGELMGLPQVTEHAVMIANEIHRLTGAKAEAA